VREFGMSARLGPVGFGGGGPAYLGQQEVRSRDYAEATQRVIDEEVEALLKDADARAAAILREHRDVLDKVAALLVEKEVATGDEVYAIAGREKPTEVVEVPTPADVHATDGRAPDA
jgi:cell division protease FtsH